MYLLNQISLSPEVNGEAYFPFLSAIEKQIINPEQIAAPLEDPAGVIIANGKIPNGYKNAGVVSKSGDIWAYDFAAIDVVDNGKRMFVMPTSKEAVVAGENFVDEGAVTLMNEEGLIKVPALVTRNEWMAARYRAKGSSVSSLGRLSVILCGGFHRYEAINVDNSGVIEAKSYMSR